MTASTPVARTMGAVQAITEMTSSNTAPSPSENGFSFPARSPPLASAARAPCSMLMAALAVVHRTIPDIHTTQSCLG